jgi:glycosyltransferase involved in cell wall biosynthesis
MSTVVDPVVLLAVRVPPVLAAVRYRAYNEKLVSGSVCDWVVSRHRQSAAQGWRVVYLCESVREQEYLAQSCAESESLETLVVHAPDELHLCRDAIERCRASTLIVCGFSHAIAAPSFMRCLVQCHHSISAEMTDVIDSTFADPLFIIQSTLLAHLLVAPMPDMPGTVVQRAVSLKAIHRHNPALARDFKWTRISAVKQLKLAASRWPERIALQSARDIEILREALADDQFQNPSGSFIEAYKRGAIAVRHQRLRRRTTAKRRQSVIQRRPIRILYASNGSAFTGAHQSLCHLIGALDRAKYEPFGVVSFSGTFVDKLRERGVTVTCPEQAIGDGDLENFVFARRVLADCSPDLIHANHNIGMPLTAAALAARIPLVQHVRVQTPRDLKEQIHVADATIAVSHFVRERLAELDIDLGRVEVIWNGVDTDQFKPDVAQKVPARQQLGVSPDEFVVAVIARMDKSKRHGTVIDAVRLMREANGRGHLILLGGLSGDRTYFHGIRRRIEEQGMIEHVTLIDFMPDVRPVLYASDALALVSEDEPLSRAVLEAMACGLPVVVAESGGTKEVVAHGQTGYVVPLDDVQRLCDTLSKIAANPGLASSIGGAAASYIQRSMTAAVCANKTMEVYERVLRGDYAQKVAKRHQRA